MPPKAKHAAPVMNFHVESDSRRPEVMIPTAMKMIPAMIIAAARKKVTERRLFPSCELLPLKNDPVGVCADADATPRTIINIVAIRPFKALRPNAIAISLRPRRAALEFPRPGRVISSLKVFISWFSFFHLLIVSLSLSQESDFTLTLA